MHFASINKLGRDYLAGHLVLTSAINKPELFYKIDNPNNRFFVHHFRICKPGDITPEFLSVMKKAYAIGLREHV